MQKNEIVIRYDELSEKNLTVEFLKNCGHHLAGEILECTFDAGKQYISGGFAAPYFFDNENDENEV